MSRILVRVTASARADELAGWQDGTLLVRVRAAPERGKANDAVCGLIAKTLGVPKSRVAVARGGASREKLLEIEGIGGEELRRKLGAPAR